jgi:hypothetical protein
MMQRRPNPWSKDPWILISKFYIDFKKVTEKFLHRPPSVLKNQNLPLGGKE